MAEAAQSSRAERGGVRDGAEEAARRIQDEGRMRTRSMSMSMREHEHFQAAPLWCCAVNLLWSVAAWVGGGRARGARV